MTDKKEALLKTALELFASDGFKATSTSRIAQDAGVSEALIFKHFQNKEGLLKAVIEEGEDQAKLLFANIVLETDPKTLIQKFIELPFDFPDSDKNYWKLIYKIKWEIEYDTSAKMQPLRLALKNAFDKLTYKNATQEAEFLMQFMDGISGNILRGKIETDGKLKNFLLEKYNLK